MDLLAHNRAVWQLRSVLRDLDVATRGVARYRVTEGSPPADLGFRSRVTAVSQLLFKASNDLGGVPTGKGTNSVPDDGDPGAVLCQAAREVIRAWRQPRGGRACRDAAIEQFAAALAALAQAARGLADRARPPLADHLRAVHECLGDAIFCLAGALEDDDGDSRLELPNGRA
jgi:hypothetical protein